MQAYARHLHYGNMNLSGQQTSTAADMGLILWQHENQWTANQHSSRHATMLKSHLQEIEEREQGKTNEDWYATACYNPLQYPIIDNFWNLF